ncbi:hypothetical protein SpCBS45565_g05649 [Spizellomyces sp. 'palustris']|nr:hypothetical protein SpCBS45565_g05649 [Spizellomyces sp. 'palustris']
MSTSEGSVAQVQPSGPLARRSSAAALAKLDDITTDLRRSSAWADGIITGDDEDGANAGQIKALLEHAKNIVVQLRTVMENDYEVDFKDEDGQLPSYDTLVSKLSDAFRHQKEINQMNAKLISVNYVVNLSNFAKNRHLQKAVIRGRQQVLELQNTVATLEGSVDVLSVEVAVQRKTAERLKTALDNTRSLLETTMKEYRQELNRQREMIRRQSTVIGELYRSKFNQDFILDSTLFLFCLWAANTTVVDMPLRTAVDFVMRQIRWWWLSPRTSESGRLATSLWFRKRTIWTRQAAKLGLIIFFMRRLRHGAKEYGIHNRIGATYPYITSFFAMMYTSMAQRINGLSPPSSEGA